MNHFYSKLVSIETITVELETLNLTDKQKTELAEMIDLMVHQTVMDTVLTHLPEKDKAVFLGKLKNDSPLEETMQFLKDRVGDIEEKISDAIGSLQKELKADIVESQNLFQKY